MEINEMLKEAGLAGNESKIYLELLKKGELNANKISRSISMDRTLTYTVLNHLIDKGFVNYKIKEGKKLFKASDPGIFLTNLRKEEIIINELIEKLGKIKKDQSNDYEVTIYEGIEGIRPVSRIMLEYKRIDSFGATGRVYDLLYESGPIMKEMVKKGYTSRVILPPDIKKHKFTQNKGVKVRCLDVRSEATTSIFGDYVLIHLIKNKEIADSYLAHFEILWKFAKE